MTNKHHITFDFSTLSAAISLGASLPNAHARAANFLDAISRIPNDLHTAEAIYALSQLLECLLEEYESAPVEATNVTS